MTQVIPEVTTSTVTFKHDCLKLVEVYEDDIMTDVQIRLEDGFVLMFVTDYDRQLMSTKMSYKEFKDEMLQVIRGRGVRLKHKERE